MKNTLRDKAKMIDENQFTSAFNSTNQQSNYIPEASLTSPIEKPSRDMTAVNYEILSSRSYTSAAQHHKHTNYTVKEEEEQEIDETEDEEHLHKKNIQRRLNHENNLRAIQRACLDNDNENNDYDNLHFEAENI